MRHNFMIDMKPSQSTLAQIIFVFPGLLPSESNWGIVPTGCLQTHCRFNPQYMYMYLGFKLLLLSITQLLCSCLEYLWVLLKEVLFQPGGWGVGGGG